MSIAPADELRVDTQDRGLGACCEPLGLRLECVDYRAHSPTALGRAARFTP